MNNSNGYFNKLSSILKINVYETLWNILNVYSYCYIKISNSSVMVYINYINTKLCSSIKSLFFVINDKITIDIIHKGGSILTLNTCHNLNKQINDIEYESDTRELCTLERDELDKHMKIYSTKKNLITLNNYYDIGYFDIWEFGNGLTKVAINVEKEKIIDIND
jgi:hypothetical protein